MLLLLYLKEKTHSTFDLTVAKSWTIRKIFVVTSHIQIFTNLLLWLKHVLLLLTRACGTLYWLKPGFAWCLFLDRNYSCVGILTFRAGKFLKVIYGLVDGLKYPWQKFFLHIWFDLSFRLLEILQITVVSCWFINLFYGIHSVPSILL